MGDSIWECCDQRRSDRIRVAFRLVPDDPSQVSCRAACVRQGPAITTRSATITLHEQSRSSDQITSRIARLQETPELCRRDVLRHVPFTEDRTACGRKSSPTSAARFKQESSHPGWYRHRGNPATVLGHHVVPHRIDGREHGTSMRRRFGTRKVQPWERPRFEASGHQ
jgi:hypothetical protein